MKSEIVLNGIKMKVLGEYTPYLLVKFDGEYLILINDVSHEYTIWQNFGNNEGQAWVEFDSLKYREE